MSKKILLCVDCQVDFIEGGKLAVNGGVDAMNNLASHITQHKDDYHSIVCTVDFHPYNHCSFKENGGQWPLHCVAHTIGASIAPMVTETFIKENVKPIQLTKGNFAKMEEYSISDNFRSWQDLSNLLYDNDIKEIDVVGLVREICVLDSIKGIHKHYPSIKMNVFLNMTPSLDGGEAFNRYAAENSSWLKLL